MNSRRDIERTLDQWLVDGPSVMPDRLFDAVLDRVERTPQRRLARLTVRLTDMNPRIRLYTLAAAGLIVALVGVYFFNRAGQNPSVGASPSAPAVTPAPTVSLLPPALVPAELRHVWMGGPRPIPGLDPDAGVTLTFDDFGNFWMTQSNLDESHVLESHVQVREEGNGFGLQTAVGETVCDVPSAGGYSWTLSPSGETLELAGDSDGCAVRATVVPGTYWRMDCPIEGDRCLGAVDAGTYGSQFFDPFVAPIGAWSPRFNALGYSVPDGWTNDEDWPGFFLLSPTTGPSGTINLVSDVVVSNQAEPCSEVPDATIGTSAAEITSWLSTAEGLLAKGRQPVTVGGLDGSVIDLSLRQGWTQTCPWSDGRPVRALLSDTDPAPGFSWAMEADHGVRLYVLDVADGRSMAILVETPSLPDFGTFVGSATPVIESFVFNP